MPHLVCLFSLSWYPCGFSTPCHATGGPSEVPLLANSEPAAGTLGFSGLLLLCLLAGVVGALHPVSGCSCCGVVCLVCRWGSPAAFPLLPFPYLRMGVLLAKVSPEFVGYEGGFGCPSWFFILFRCLLVHLLYLELGWFLVTRWWLLLRLLVLVSSDARSHIPDAFASSSTPISGSWMVLAPVFSCALPWVRPSRCLCWLLTWGD